MTAAQKRNTIVDGPAWFGSRCWVASTCIFLGIAAVASGPALAQSSIPSPISVVTFNALVDRYEQDDDWGGDAAGVPRTQKTADLLYGLATGASGRAPVDIFAFQELSPWGCEDGRDKIPSNATWIDMWLTTLGFEAVTSFPKEHDGEYGSTCADPRWQVDGFWTRIYVRSSRFLVVAKGEFDHGADAKFGISAVVRDKQLSFPEYAVTLRASHWDYVSDAPVAETHLLEAEATVRAVADHPHAVVLGDFNFEPCQHLVWLGEIDYLYAVMTAGAGLVDSALAQEQQPASGCGAAKSLTGTLPSGSRLDYILHGSGFTHSDYEVIKDQYGADGPDPSDHYPVYVRLHYVPATASSSTSVDQPFNEMLGAF